MSKFFTATSFYLDLIGFFSLKIPYKIALNIIIDLLICNIIIKKFLFLGVYPSPFTIGRE